MAFDLRDLSEIAALANGKRSLAYDTTDSLTAVLATGYFNAASGVFVHGDRLDIVAAGERCLAVVAVSTARGVNVISPIGPGGHHIPATWTGTEAEYTALGVNATDRTFYVTVD